MRGRGDGREERRECKKGKKMIKGQKEKEVGEGKKRNKLGEGMKKMGMERMIMERKRREPWREN